MRAKSAGNDNNDDEAGDTTLKAHPIGVAHQNAEICVGQICCDSEGKLNSQSLMLEGSMESSRGVRVLLNLDNIDVYGVFPGQIVAVEGTNPDSTTLYAQRLFQGMPHPLDQTDASLLLAYHHLGATIDDDDGEEIERAYMEGMPLHMMVACGPYTTVDGLDFRPFEDLLAAVDTEKPDVLVLMGPFLDAAHPTIDAADFDYTFEELFATKIAAPLNERVRDMPWLEVVLIPSVSDVQHDFVFPQPPLPLPELGLDDRIKVLPNPFMFEVNEVNVGVVTNDILKAMLADEASRVPAGYPSDRVSRFVDHLIQQRSFYPLFPPPIGSQLDLAQSHYLNFPGVTPDVLILPSNLKWFVKEVNGVLVINPGRLAIGRSGGTYSSHHIFPMELSALKNRGETEVEHAVASRTLSRIIRV